MTPAPGEKKKTILSAKRREFDICRAASGGPGFLRSPSDDICMANARLTPHTDPRKLSNKKFSGLSQQKKKKRATGLVLVYFTGVYMTPKAPKRSRTGDPRIRRTGSAEADAELLWQLSPPMAPFQFSATSKRLRVAALAQMTSTRCPVGNISRFLLGFFFLPRLHFLLPLPRFRFVTSTFSTFYCIFFSSWWEMLSSDDANVAPASPKQRGNVPDHIYFAF